jgi:hypothetical protein
MKTNPRSPRTFLTAVEIGVLGTNPARFDSSGSPRGNDPDEFASNAGMKATGHPSECCFLPPHQTPRQNLT